MMIHRAGERASIRANSAYFTGTVWQDPIVDPPQPARARAARVAFEPGARTAWHTHPLGQTLYVTQGVGWLCKEGEAKIEIRAGDTVYIPPNVRHWHGATASNGMVHIAIHEALDGVHIEWQEHVADADYQA